MRKFDKDVKRIIGKKLKKLGLTTDDVATYNMEKLTPPKGYFYKEQRVVIQTKDNRYFLAYNPQLYKEQDDSE